MNYMMMGYVVIKHMTESIWGSMAKIYIYNNYTNIN